VGISSEVGRYEPLRKYSQVTLVPYRTKTQQTTIPKKELIIPKRALVLPLKCLVPMSTLICASLRNVQAVPKKVMNNREYSEISITQIIGLLKKYLITISAQTENMTKIRIAAASMAEALTMP